MTSGERVAECIDRRSLALKWSCLVIPSMGRSISPWWVDLISGPSMLIYSSPVKGSAKSNCSQDPIARQGGSDPEFVSCQPRIETDTCGKPGLSRKKRMESIVNPRKMREW